jgi:Spy/CpxP family protein refolding chaperone
MKYLTTFLLASILALPVLASPGDGSRMLKGLTRHLDLTTEQQAQVKEIFAAQKPKMEAIRKQMKSLREETDVAIKAILTDEQLQEFETMQKKRKEKYDRHSKHERYSEHERDE